MNYIKFKNQDSRYINGLVISELPPITKPQMRVSETVVDGVDGSYIEELGYSSYDKPVTIGLTQRADINEVIKFFSGKGDVIFSNEPDKFYKAHIVGQIDYARVVRFRTATVVFRVQPHKYLVDEQYVTTGYEEPTEKHLITGGVYADGTNVETSPDVDGQKTITRYVEVKPSNDYELQGTLAPEGAQITVYFYNSEQTLLEQQSVSHTNNIFTFTTPANTKYLKFSGYTQVLDVSTINLIEKYTETVYGVENWGNETSKPIMRISGTGTVKCRVNGDTVFSYTFPTGDTAVYIDSEAQDAYFETVLKNRNMTGEFPVFHVGSNAVMFEGTVTAVEILARSRWI